MPDDKKVDDADRSLFREAVGTVKRIKAPEPPKVTPPAPEPTQRLKDEAYIVKNLLQLGPEDADLDFGDFLAYLQDGYPPKTLKKLRRGLYSVGAEIDLHGCTAQSAKILVDEFIMDCKNARILCVKIIHGKGWRSGHQGPILKNKVNHWLRQRDDVIAFCSARRKDGGTGAVYALFKGR